MTDFVKNVLVFVLLVTVMKSLVNNDGYRVYFKFFSGIVLVLFMASPLINFLSGGSGWYSVLEEEIFNFDMENINNGLEVADGRFGEIIMEESKEDIERQIIKLAKKRNLDVKDVDVKLVQEDGSIQAVSVDIGIVKDSGSAQGNTGQGNVPENTGESTGDIDIGRVSTDIETVNIMPGEDNNVQESNSTGKKKAVGKNVEKLKDDISSYFLIKEADVNIWE